MATLTRKSPAAAHKPFAHYSHVVTAQGANKLVFCAGQVAADPTGKVLPPDDFAAQTKMVMENLRLALADGGAAFKDVVKVTIFICNPYDVPQSQPCKMSPCLSRGVPIGFSSSERKIGQLSDE